MNKKPVYCHHNWDFRKPSLWERIFDFHPSSVKKVCRRCGDYWYAWRAEEPVEIIGWVEKEDDKKGK